ncbi:MAG: hypothetical protein JWM82_2058 [Myxococcales bacterium]|nr:hypothetical protein [Myxococcales bacterium]
MTSLRSLRRAKRGEGWERGLLFLVLALSACASQSDLNVLYGRGIKAARKDDWETAMKNLGDFTSAACPWVHPDPRCREAYLALGRGHERRGAPAHAWASYDRALGMPPHAKDAVVQADAERARQELVDKQQQSGDHGPLLVRYRDEVPEEYSLRSVTISVDFTVVVTRDKNAGELHSPDFLPVFSGSFSPGGHVLEVESVHDCKMGQSVPCARSHVRRSWGFDTVARTPLTLELRGYADAGDDNAPAQPTVELTKR